LVENNGIQSANAMKTTNPAILQVAIPQAAEAWLSAMPNHRTITSRYAEACQLAQNLPLIAQTYYNGTVSPIPQTLTLSTMGGGCG